MYLHKLTFISLASLTVAAEGRKIIYTNIGNPHAVGT